MPASTALRGCGETDSSDTPRPVHLAVAQEQLQRSSRSKRCVASTARERGFEPWKMETISDDSLPDEAAARTLFAELDIDGNGTLDMTEVGLLLRALQMPRSVAQAKECMREMDEDCNGEVEFEEFYLWWQKALHKQQEARWHAEATMDSVKLCNNRLSSLHGLLPAIRDFFPLHNPALTLQWLDLSHNRLSTIDMSVFEPLPNLTILSLHANEFTSFDEIRKLGSCCKRVRKLSLHGCPLDEQRDYRRRALHALAGLRHLHHLDFAPITQLERQDVRAHVAATQRNRVRRERSTPSVFLRARQHLQEMASAGDLALPKMPPRSESVPPPRAAAKTTRRRRRQSTKK